MELGMTPSQDIAHAIGTLENDTPSWDLLESPSTELLIPTLQTPPPSPQCSQDPLISDLWDETVIDIKLATLHLLMLALNEFIQETCYGCQTGHPSQVQHSCLQELSEYFFDTYYDDVMIRLQTERFIPAIRLFVRSSTADGSGTQIRRVAEHIMCELRSERYIVCAINDNIGHLLDASTCARRVKPAMLRMIGNYWAGLHLV
ncbi:uncharacterized protein LOC113028086 [Astatotilapia calliptera]|uniref:uncharacterized protein LOC113009389 n=1 Tax=Astatotilapia calliptera TaxID=8154 RepID=UPI000E3FE53F|nr:uncharacterized protein LOC113009389 [Astatotilapia calliptera]XP_026021075.1 uncharacterized protein LOC113020936 [Astatotilapia calliptera]XP_026031557.1 uncharacterized protein LOC113026706 [Astatotilapia calliptera]XP_026033860.1 uncharacterized protein LOC113028086 [Astatotilapia calliptera]